MKLILFTVTAICATFGAAGTRRSDVRQASTCGPLDSAMSATVLDVTDLATSSDTTQVRVRTALGIPNVTSSYIHPITNTSMCNTAGELINTADTLPRGTPHLVYLVQIGSVFWAEDTAMRRGHRGEAFIMNGKLTSVVTRVFD